MKILVFGAGAIGSMFGGFLSRRHDVTLLGRRTHLSTIRKNGLKVSGIWGRHTFRNLKTEWDFKRLLKSKAHFDLILVTVKSYDTPKATKAIKRVILRSEATKDPKQRSFGPSALRMTTVLSIQNGLGNAETLLKHIPRKQLILGRVITGVEIPNPGAIKITVTANPVAIGNLPHFASGGGNVSFQVRKIVKEFSHCGIPTIASSNIQAVLWSKVIYNCALNPLASIRGCHYGALGEESETREMMNEVIREIYRVAARAKVQLNPKTAEGYIKLFYAKLLPRTYHHRPSMLQDLEKGKRTEIDALSGAIVKLGKKFGVNTPMNQRLVREIKKKEEPKPSLRGGRPCFAGAKPWLRRGERPTKQSR